MIDLTNEELPQMTRQERIKSLAREYVAENPQLSASAARKLARHIISDNEQADHDEQQEFDEFVKSVVTKMRSRQHSIPMARNHNDRTQEKNKWSSTNE